MSKTTDAGLVLNLDVDWWIALLCLYLVLGGATVHGVVHHSSLGQVRWSLHEGILILATWTVGIVVAAFMLYGLRHDAATNNSKGTAVLALSGLLRVDALAVSGALDGAEMLLLSLFHGALLVKLTQLPVLPNGHM